MGAAHVSIFQSENPLIPSAWANSFCFVWKTLGRITRTFLWAHRGEREKWEMLGTDPGAGLLPQHTLLLHFLNTLFPFIFPVGWSGQSLSEITGVKLRAHKFEGEEKVAVHCWTSDGTSLCHRGREKDCLWSSSVLNIYCQICCQTTYFSLMQNHVRTKQQARIFHRLPQPRPSLAQSNHPSQAGWVPEGQTQLSFCCRYTWVLQKADYLLVGLRVARTPSRHWWAYLMLGCIRIEPLCGFKWHEWCVRELGKRDQDPPVMNVPCLDSSCSSRNWEALITAPAIQNMCDYLCKKADERQT